MMRMRFSGFFIVVGLLCSAAVWAQEAYTTKAVNLRAGPDRDYPLVAQLAPGTPVTVAGCVSDYRWCDVIYGDVRGWAFAKSLQYAYQNRQVPIYGYGAAIGLPIVTFSLLSYWDSYYRNRPFYRDHPRWENRPYRAGPGFVAQPRGREPQFRQPRPVQPQIRPPGPVQPQYRPPRVERPQVQPQPQPRPQVQPQPRPQVQPQPRPQVQPQPRPQVQPQPRPQVQPQPRPQQPQMRPPGGQEGNRPAPGGERRIDRTPSRESGQN